MAQAKRVGNSYCDKCGQGIRSTPRHEIWQTVIIGAVEGGTGYWASVSDYDPDRPRAILYEILPDESGYQEKGMVLDADAVERGLEDIRMGLVEMNDDILASILMLDFAGKDGGFDADSADVVAQVALLGEIRYS